MADLHHKYCLQTLLPCIISIVYRHQTWLPTKQPTRSSCPSEVQTSCRAMTRQFRGSAMAVLPSLRIILVSCSILSHAVTNLVALLVLFLNCEFNCIDIFLIISLMTTDQSWVLLYCSFGLLSASILRLASARRANVQEYEWFRSAEEFAVSCFI